MHPRGPDINMCRLIENGYKSCYKHQTDGMTEWASPTFDSGFDSCRGVNRKDAYGGKLFHSLTTEGQKV